MGYHELLYFGSAADFLLEMTGLPIDRELALALTSLSLFPLFYFYVYIANADATLSNLIRPSYNMIDRIESELLKTYFTIQVKFYPYLMVLMLFAMTELLLYILGFGLFMIAAILGLVLGIFALIAYILAIGTDHLLSFIGFQLNENEVIGLVVLYLLLILFLIFSEQQIKQLLASEEPRKPLITSWRHIDDIFTINDIIFMSRANEIQIFARAFGKDYPSYELLARLIGHRMPIKQLYFISDQFYSFSLAPGNSGIWIGIWSKRHPWEFRGSLLDKLGKINKNRSYTGQHDRRETNSSPIHKYSRPLAFSDEFCVLTHREKITIFDNDTLEEIKTYAIPSGMYFRHLSIIGGKILGVVKEYKSYKKKTDPKQFIYLWDLNKDTSDPIQITPINSELNTFSFNTNILLGYNKTTIEIFNLTEEDIFSSSIPVGSKSIRKIIIEGDYVFVANIGKQIIVYNIQTKTQNQLDTEDQIRSISFSNGNLYVLTNQNEIYSYRLDDFKF